MGTMIREAEAAARASRVPLRLVAVHGPKELDRAFSTMSADGADALVVFPSPMLFNERRRIVDFATQHRLPLMANHREFAEPGGLMSYGASIIDLLGRAATYVGDILDGAAPGDLPVQQPTRFELVVNLKAARALGLELPPSIILRADAVIE
jgi:putative tryptophan/tyrosine transport system substrate-binding protein